MLDTGAAVFLIGKKMYDKLYVTKGLNRNLILGRDWLKKNNVRLYFNQQCCQKAFDFINERLSVVSLLAYPDNFYNYNEYEVRTFRVIDINIGIDLKDFIHFIYHI